MATLLVSTRKGLLVYRLDQNGFELAGQHFMGDPVSSTTVDSAGHWYAALNLGHFGPKLQKSTDHGESWQEVACPSLPEADAEAEKKPKIDQVWVMEALAEPGHLLAGTIPGALFETTDGAESWQLNAALWEQPQREKWMGGGFDESGVHSIAIHPENSNQWVAAVSVGGVWHTKDAGQTWALNCKGMNAAYMPEDMADAEDMQDPHRLVQSPADPNRVWVQHHCGIFVSDDAGRSYRECKLEGQSSFGFAVVVHPTQPDTAWFVPAIKDESRYPKDGKLVVLRTDDAGHTFTTQTKGLPEKECYDLIYRHALAVDESGQTLVMGSTTGNLWMTRDGGANWQALSQTLPPIYALQLLPNRCK